MFMEAVKQTVLFDLLLFNIYIQYMRQRDFTKYIVWICLVKQFSTDFYEIMEEENMAHSKMKI